MPAVARTPSAVLALVAVLLLALLPTIGRLGAGPVACADGEATPSHTMQQSMHGMSMHDMAGMTPEQHRVHMAMMARMAARAPAPERAPSHDSHDCPYCPLLSGLTDASRVSWSPAAPLALAPWSVRAVVQRATAAPVPALGAQGPPPYIAT
ncbi:DUF2946 family protein [Lysobacter claricitrinus]|uniref:DUF2946 family protein n=1 Tax=Lysobacter claricitrinus TaxID=3367728 RepID=UPI0038B36D8E